MMQALMQGTQLNIPQIWVSFTREVKRPGREADHSLSTTAEVNNAWFYAVTPYYQRTVT
jgi:hypothetical protein